MTDVKDKLIKKLFEALDDEVLAQISNQGFGLSEASLSILEITERHITDKSKALEKIEKLTVP